jgi:hypothetical protein
MRKLLTTVTFAAALALGAVSTANAVPPATGIPALDAILAAYYEDVEAACAPAGGGSDAAACEAALLAFAALTDPAAILALPEVVAAISAGTLTTAAVTAAVTSPAFEGSFATAAADLNTLIDTVNAGNPGFLAAVADVRADTLGVETAGGDEDQVSPEAV